MTTLPSPHLEIRYCTRCRWLLRAAWYAQELLTTFEHALAGVTLSPGDSGEFRVLLDGDCLWDRARDGGFPEVKVLKQILRDRIAPERDLGHSDR